MREEIFRAFAENKMTLLTLRTAHVSLEDVFMELTQNDTVPDAFTRRRNETASVDENTPEQNEVTEELASDGDGTEVSSGAEWVETDGEGDETNAGDL